ncbi:FAD-dependent oxidoreductase [Alcanivorax balearicus MACL04]|uniref:FAD-dependent oxidoreductase n=1 Tax=Alloalcanivorax balearicus MACL04 TaxID=1177182 RepID=A0ABT2R4H4_9GAMM|nr:D-arabinono-1,4-lactone oxidase [Alloalcanivorax balearicus]MCU5784675.1 FAD-dependent oxidoreductase [Alloalcanivorax balearicus MACL04]
MLPTLPRRALLKALLVTAGAAILPLSARGRAEQPPSWNNWSGNQSATPKQLLYPAAENQLADLLRQSSGTVRAFGGSHSFSPIVPTDDTLLSLEALNGLRGQDDNGHLTFGAGTRLGAASAQAWQVGRSFRNEPDINLQSLAGAIATGTHGTGITLPCLSAQVGALRVVRPDGEAVSLTAGDGDAFQAACCGLGALGVATQVTLRGDPAYRLREHTWTLPLDEAIDFVGANRDRYRNIEFFAFPLGRTAIVKTMELTDQEDQPLIQDDSNDLLEMVCELSLRAPWLTATLQKLVTLFVSDQVRNGPAHRIYANRRTVRFNEMEYTVPADDGLDCLREVCERIRDQDINVFFPIEYRYTAADDTLLSMFSERAGASISVHQYYKQDYRPLFDAVEPIFQRFAGRPHWGKLHSLDATRLRPLYPRFDDFLALRREFDPEGRMLNPYLRRVLGIETGGRP